MWEWLQDNAWAGFTAAAILLAVVETLSLDLIFIMLAGGAAVGAVSSVVGAPIWLAALLALGSSLALLGVVRPIAQRHLQESANLRTGVDALIGSKAEVLEQVDSVTGQINLNGERWTARSFDNHSVIEVGQVVDVVEISGATALVFPADQ